jgi:general secretion pathway protein E
MDNLNSYNIDYSFTSKIDKNILIKNNILPLYEQDLFLLVATTDISQDSTYLIEIYNKPIKFVSIDQKSLDFHLQYLTLTTKLHSLATKALKSIYKNSENSYIIEFFDIFLRFSSSHFASDIHCECLEKSIIFRLRIDGELNQFFRYDISLYPLFSSIIKYFGNLDISQKRIPLNGRFSRKVDLINYDMRISTMPTIYGESIVLRILDNGDIKKDLCEIGFNNYTLKIIQESISSTQGLILVTGPTGSGKTTTLYSMLNELNKNNKKIITIEDPVEYKLDGIMQVSINNDIDLTYSIVLKNILRQDPDILLIGEIRDNESLKIAMQAALTGHLVIATLHTNNSIETITRLLDLEAKPYLISSTLKMVLSQRLVRVVCEHCTKKETDNMVKSDGCSRCNFTGYKNRQVVSEILSINNDISNMIANSQTMDKIKSYLTNNNFISLKENCLDLVKKGITTYDEYNSKI